MRASQTVLLFAVVMTAVGLVAIVGGVLLVIHARRVTSPVVDRLGEWIVSAAQGLGIVATIVGLVFLAGGIDNVVRLAGG